MDQPIYQKHAKKEWMTKELLELMKQRKDQKNKIKHNTKSWIKTSEKNVEKQKKDGIMSNLKR